MTPYKLAEKFRNIKEIPGDKDNHQIMAMLKLDSDWPQHDEVAWCSAFVNYICWLLELPRSKSRFLMARSWLKVGTSVRLPNASVGNDIAVLSRGADPKSGHVGFYSGHSKTKIFLLGGNQLNTVNVTPHNLGRLLAIRRLI